MTISGVNQLLTIPAVPTIPSSLPPTGPAGGDLAGTYPNPTLAVIGSATGPIGSATVVPIVTIDAKGRVTALTSTTITGVVPGGSAGGDLTGTYPNPTLIATGPGATGPIGSTTTTPVITIDAKGRVTALSSATISVTPGNLTGPITSVGLATSIASQTGTGTKFVVDNAPTIQLPIVADTGDNTKTFAWQLSGATTATKLTIISSQTASRSATIPILGANDTFGMLGTAATWSAAQTLQLPFIADSSDATKKIGFTLSGATTATTLTIASAQTASRTLTIPVLGANDTLLTNIAGQTVSGAYTFSSVNGLLASGNAGFKCISTGTAAAGQSGGVHLYRVNSTLQPIGSAIIQSDVGQATSGFAVYVGNTPTVGMTAFTSAASIGTIASTYTGVVIAGVQTSLAAVAGQVGEVLTGTPQTTAVNFTTTATYQNLTGTLALTAGDWLITATMTFFSNSATIGGVAQVGLSSTTAAQTGSTPLNTEGLSLIYIPAGLYTTLAVDDTRSISIRYQVSAATNVFFVGKSSFSVGNPQYTASITATRMR